MLSFVGAHVPHFFKFSKQMTIILLSSYGYPETSVIQKISPSRLIPQRRCRTRPVRRPRHSRWSVPVHRANCRNPHRRVMEVSRDAVAWDMGRAASAGSGSGAAGPQSPAQAKPRPGEAPPRCSGSWETRPSPRKGLPCRMLVQGETRLRDSGSRAQALHRAAPGPGAASPLESRFLAEMG